MRSISKRSKKLGKHSYSESVVPSQTAKIDTKTIIVNSKDDYGRVNNHMTNSDVSKKDTVRKIETNKKNYRMIDMFLLFEQASNIEYYSAESFKKAKFKIVQVFGKNNIIPFPTRLESVLNNVSKNTKKPCSLIIPESGQLYYCVCTNIGSNFDFKHWDNKAKKHEENKNYKSNTTTATTSAAPIANYNYSKSSYEEESTPFQIICLISRVPCLTFMENALKCIIELCDPSLHQYVAFEPFIRSLISEVPISPDDRIIRLCWERDKVFKRKMNICFPRLKKLPICDDRNMVLLFNLCSPKVIIQIVEHLVAENSIIIHGNSENINLLSLIAEAIRSLIYPFVWQGLYLPFVPKNEWSILQSSSPYIAGVCCESPSTFQLDLFNYSEQGGHGGYRHDVPRYFFLLNVDNGHYKTIQRNIPTFYQNRNNNNPRPLQFPRPLRSNLISQLKEILTIKCKSVQTNNDGDDKVDNNNNSAPSVLESFFSSDSDEKLQNHNDNFEDSIWIDHIRIAFLEVFLCLLSHMSFYMQHGKDCHDMTNSTPVNSSTDNKKNDDNNIDDYNNNTIKSRKQQEYLQKQKPQDYNYQQQFLLEKNKELDKKVVTKKEHCLSRSKSALAFNRINAVDDENNNPNQNNTSSFDVQGFVSIFPNEWHGFIENMTNTRLFYNLIDQEQQTEKKLTIFGKLAYIWRQTSCKSMKRKMSPLTKKLQDVLNDIGFTFAASRLAIEQLQVFSLEEMNKLFTSEEKIIETLFHLGIPRFILSEDIIAPIVDNIKTKKFRVLLQRNKYQEKPPLVCTVSLSKHHANLTSSFLDNYNNDNKNSNSEDNNLTKGKNYAYFPKLRPDLVHTQTIATLPQMPFNTFYCESKKSEARGAKLSELCLKSNPFIPQENLSTPNLKTWFLEQTNCTSESHELKANEDTMEFLLSHIKLLQKSLFDKDSIIEKLKNENLKLKNITKHMEYNDHDYNIHNSKNKKKVLNDTYSPIKSKNTSNLDNELCTEENENFLYDLGTQDLAKCGASNLTRTRSSASCSSAGSLFSEFSIDSNSSGFRKIERRHSPLFIDAARQEGTSIGVNFT